MIREMTRDEWRICAWHCERDAARLASFRSELAEEAERSGESVLDANETLRRMTGQWIAPFPLPEGDA